MSTPNIGAVECSLRPVGGRVMIRRVKDPDQWHGLWLPETVTGSRRGSLSAAGFLHQGVVEAVGPGEALRDGGVGPMFCKVGDLVLYDTDPQTELQFDVFGDGVTVSSEMQVVVGIFDRAVAPALFTASGIEAVGERPPIRMLYDRLLCEKLPDDEVVVPLDSTIVVPDRVRAKEKESQVARVVAVGTGWCSTVMVEPSDHSPGGEFLRDGVLHPLGVQVGDKVVYTPWDPVDVEISGKKYVVIREPDVKAVMGEAFRSQSSSSPAVKYEGGR